ncbi:MAG TPA: protein kinase [Kofleriaceae bacterium]|nr:protein kinase [Kofleriaceae bacterium]
MIGSIVEDRYLVEEELGTGAMGRVFAARHVKVGRRVAIKIMHDELAKNAAIVERFAREAMVAARLRHPNLVSVLDVGQTAMHQPLLVLELAPGIPLSHMTCEPLHGPRVVNLIRQLLHGLSHAHTAGLIHRDLKPDNILVETTADGLEIPRIVDFGIAVAADRDDTVAGRRLTDANMVIGTPFYMSPEQARAKDIDHRTDLFSLGVIMYELLAGMPPFPGSSLDVALANVSKDAPTIAERAGIDVDPLLEAFMRKLMARRLETRFSSAREALDVLALIEIDRMAAARVLGGSPLVEVPRPMLAQGSAPYAIPTPPNSDELTTITEPPVASDESTPTEHVDPTDDDFSDLEFDPARSQRRRKRLALGVVFAALTAVVAVFALQAPPRVDAPAVDVASQDDASMAIRPVQTKAPLLPTTSVAVVKKQHVARPTTKPVTAPNVVAPPPMMVAAPMIVAAPRAPTMVLAAAPVIAPTAAPAAAPPVAIDSVDALVAKYQAVAKKLKHSAAGPQTEDLWMRFRLIRINESIATQQTRRQALALLGAIDNAIE